MRSLRSYLVSAAIVLVLVLSAAAALLVHVTERAGRREAERQLLDNTRALSLSVDFQIARYEGMLQALRDSEAIRQRDWKTFDKRARLLLSGPDAWIVVGDRLGRQLVNTRLPEGAELPHGRSPNQVWPALDAGRSRVCDLTHGFIERNIVCVDVPVMSGGRAIYYLSVIMRPQLFRSALNEQRIRDGRIAAIADRQGTVIWRNAAPERYVGKSVTPAMRRAMAREREGIFESVSLDGVPTLAAHSRSLRSGWTTIAAIPLTQVDAGAVRALAWGVGGALAFMLFGALAALILARRVSRAIASLARSALDPAAGREDAFTPTGIREIDEVGRVLEETLTQRDLSSERFELAQDVGGIGAWDWDVTTGEGRVSASYRRMHGLPEGEGPVTVEQFQATLHPADRDSFWQSWRDGSQSPGASDGNYRVLLPSGNVRWLQARGRPQFNSSGRFVRAIGITRDVTGEHEAQENLKQLNRLLEGKVEERTVERDRIWNISHDPFVIADGSGVWLAASPAWTALLGWTEDELVGRTSEWMEHPEDVARTRAEDRRLAAGETTTRFVNRFRRRDGTYRYLSWTAVPYEGRFYSVARDITDERERARALEAAEAALRQSQKMESIGQITGGLAHDFNNLLSPIIGALDLLQRRDLPDPRLKRLVEGASESAERARVLVQRLLAFARRQPLQTVPVEMGALVNGIVGLVESTVGPRTAVEVAVEEHLPPALADANQLEMALLNLAVNARDAMPEGGHLRLSVELGQVLPEDSGELSPGNYIILSVADTGVGMQAAVVERAIEPFFTTKGTERGTGLGLSMVHGLVAQLGGDLRITSMPGEGTTVSLRLPVATKLAKIDHRVQSEPSGEERGAATILLVDDEPLVRAGTAQSLMELGFSVIQAGSAEAALHLLQRHPEIRLVVTDHLMPGMTGTELARSLLLSRSDLPLLIVSGYADVDDIAPDFPRLAKPFRLSELEQAIQALIRRGA